MSDFEDEMNKPRALATVTTEKPRFHEIAAIFAIGLWSAVGWTCEMIGTSGVARKFERWGKRSIFPTSGRGHVGVAKHCAVIRFYFIYLFSCVLSDFIIPFDIK